MVEQKQSYSKWFYVAIAGGACSVLYGMYYLYNLFKGEIELNDDDLIEIDEIKKEIDKNTEPTKDNVQTETVDSEISSNLNVETALKILSLINRKTEEQMKLMKPEIEERRRNAFVRKDDFEYEQICAEILEERNRSYMSISEKILNEFNFKYEDLAKCLQTIPPMEIEKRMLNYEKPLFEKGKPNREQVKESFKFYGMNCIGQMREFQNAMNGVPNDPYQQEMMMYRLMITKFRIDDELYMRNQITEQQLRYLLNEYNLYEDPEIKTLIMKMSKYDEMLGSGFS